MKNLFLIGLVSISTNIFSQDCSKELLAEKPGTWKAGSQGSINNVTAIDLAKEKAVVAKIHKMVSSAYSPIGCQVSYSTVYGKHLSAAGKWWADPYHYALYILRYLCDEGKADKSKFYVDYSTPTTVNITANSIFSLNNLYAGELPADDSRGYLKLSNKPQKENGFYNMGEAIIGDAGGGNKLKEYRWLITYNDTLPFSYISRKEYLLIQKKRLEKDIKDSPSEKDYLQKFINNIDAYLQKPEPELNQPAICDWNEEQRFEKFVDEGTRNSFFAVKPNPAYYRKQLPKSSPQFFTVVYKISHGDPVFEENIDRIKKAVDFSMLKTMLGK